MVSLERGMAFVDLPNITTGGYSYGIRRVNFLKLADVLLRNTRPVGCCVYVTDKGDRQGLFRLITKSGLSVIPVSPGKSVDGRLIFDMLIGAQKNDYDIAIIASGDRDYIPVINEVKRLKKEVRVVSFSNSIGEAMRVVGDSFIKLDDFIDEISLSATREMHKAICSDCGEECEVPFKPMEGREVYCNKCFRRRRG